MNEGKTRSKRKNGRDESGDQRDVARHRVIWNEGGNHSEARLRIPHPVSIDLHHLFPRIFPMNPVKAAPVQVKHRPGDGWRTSTGTPAPSPLSRMHEMMPPANGNAPFLVMLGFKAYREPLPGRRGGQHYQGAERISMTAKITIRPHSVFVFCRGRLDGQLRPSSEPQFGSGIHGRHDPFHRNSRASMTAVSASPPRL